MKTTLEVPDALFRRAKEAAGQRGIPFRFGVRGSDGEVDVATTEDLS